MADLSTANGEAASTNGEDRDTRPGVLADGFNMIAKDLDRAFCLGLSANQAIIMNSVREQSWTAAMLTRRKGEPRPDPIPAQINLSHLAATAGVNRSRLSTALKGLFNGGVLRRLEAYVLINKDYSKWLDDAGQDPRFTPHQLEFIRAVKPSRKTADVAKCNSDEVLQNATVDDEGCCKMQQQVLQNATVTVAKCNSATIGTGASEDLEIKKIVVLTDNGQGTVKRNERPVTIKDLVAEAKELHGVDVARQVMEGASDILGQFGEDRLDCYLAAIRQAKMTKTTINSPHRWFLAIGEQYYSGAASKPSPKIIPSPLAADEKHRKQFAAFEAGVASIEEEI